LIPKLIGAARRIGPAKVKPVAARGFGRRGRRRDRCPRPSISRSPRSIPLPRASCDGAGDAKRRLRAGLPPSTHSPSTGRGRPQRR
jgi:hypothetical protein